MGDEQDIDRDGAYQAFTSAQNDEVAANAIEQYEVSRDGFVAYWADRWKSDGASKRSATSSDLVLAYACASGCQLAMSDFAVEYRALAIRAAQRVGLQGTECDDVADEVVMSMLFPRTDKPSGIHGFMARGPLRGWVASYTMRYALRVRRDLGRRRARRERYLHHAPEDIVKDLELDVSKQEIATAIKEAFETAVDGLGPKDRALLHWSYVGGMNVTQIGELYGVHRATAARWVASARNRMVVEMSRILLGDEEVSKMLGLMDDVRSRLNLSLSRVLCLPVD